MPEATSSPRRIVIGVGGGIAAYKTAHLVRHFTETGYDVTVVPTQAALEFVGAPTWSALSGKPATAQVFEDVHEVRHVRLGQQADLVVVAPATADLIAKAAHGLADDLLTNVLLTARGPVVLAPAMHTEMWQHPATRANVALLRERGVHVIEPVSGRLTGADSGPGRMPEPGDIYRAGLAVLGEAALTATGTAELSGLAGLRVVVTAGGTREALDPVRYLGNRSSGKQGVALAEVARDAGAEVTLIAGAMDVPAPSGMAVVRIESALQLKESVEQAVWEAGADIVVMAAAVADFRPAAYVDTKIKKTHTEPGQASDESAPTIQLVRNPDILAGLVAERGTRRVAGQGDGPVIVGFAAETGDAEHSVLELGREKLARKGCDVLVVNEVGRDKTFGADDNTVSILVAGRDEVATVGPASKAEVAAACWKHAAAVRQAH